MKITIKTNDFILCENSSKNMWANTKKGTWGRGLINDSSDPHKVERTGRLGEMAFARSFDLNVNFDYMKFGDQYDFKLNNWKLDVKTAARNYGAGLIKARDASGRNIPLAKDIYVFCYVENENRLAQTANINIVGFELKENILKKELVKARKGNHLNYDISYNQLKDINKLLEIYKRWTGHIC